MSSNCLIRKAAADGAAMGERIIVDMTAQI
jgi:hypothetical protein